MLKFQKLIGNYITRFYSESTSNLFKRWKNVLKMHKSRELMLKFIIKHNLKHQFYCVKSAFQQLVTKQKQKQRR